MAQAVQGLTAQGWQVAAQRTGLFQRADQLRLAVAQPMRITGGAALINLPTAWSMANNSATYDLRSVSLAPDGHERNVELAYSLPFAIGTLDLNFVYRDQPGHIAHAADDKAVALRWLQRF